MSQHRALQQRCSQSYADFISQVGDSLKDLSVYEIMRSAAVTVTHDSPMGWEFLVAYSIRVEVNTLRRFM